VVLNGSVSPKIAVHMPFSYLWQKNIICIICRIWSSHSCGDEKFYLPEYNTVKSDKINQRFGEIFHLHLQDQIVSQSGNHHEALFAACFKLVSCLASFTLKMKVTCSLKRQLTFTLLNNVISWKIELLIIYMFRLIGTMIMKFISFLFFAVYYLRYFKFWSHVRQIWL
jgi:hypothetical protein